MLDPAVNHWPVPLQHDDCRVPRRLRQKKNRNPHAARAKQPSGVTAQDRIRYNSFHPQCASEYLDAVALLPCATSRTNLCHASRAAAAGCGLEPRSRQLCSHHYACFPEAAVPTYVPTNRPAVQFLQRSRALSLYRTILRATRRIGDPTTRAETRRFARDEFERHRNVTDLVCCPLHDMARALHRQPC